MDRLIKRQIAAVSRWYYWEQLSIGKADGCDHTINPAVVITHSMARYQAERVPPVCVSASDELSRLFLGGWGMDAAMLYCGYCSQAEAKDAR